MYIYWLLVVPGRDISTEACTVVGIDKGQLDVGIEVEEKLQLVIDGDHLVADVEMVMEHRGMVAQDEREIQPERLALQVGGTKTEGGDGG